MKRILVPIMMEIKVDDDFPNEDMTIKNLWSEISSIDPYPHVWSTGYEFSFRPDKLKLKDFIKLFNDQTKK